MKIYLAGPDVFRPDALEWAEASRKLLDAHEHQALIPLDNTETSASGIFAANMALIDSADAVLANLNPFRGHEPDSGTCFEIGYAIAKGKIVVGYLDDARPQLEKLSDAYQLSARGTTVDPDGLTIENFGLPVNLMLGVSCRIVQGGLSEALLFLAAK